MIIGITGGIGSGKSVICLALRKRGYTVYDSDKEAKRILVEDHEVRHAVCELFGADSYCGNQLNSQYIAQIVFSNPSLLSQLNRIVHPRVVHDVCETAKRVKSQDDLFFVESALLFTSGLATVCDRVVCVEAPEEVRVQRVIERDFCGEHTPDSVSRVRVRMVAQRCEERSATSSNAIRLQNDGKTTIEQLIDIILKSL